jgi:hypothetical protein
MPNAVNEPRASSEAGCESGTQCARNQNPFLRRIRKDPFFFSYIEAERRRCIASNGASPLRVGTSGLLSFMPRMKAPPALLRTRSSQHTIALWTTRYDLGMVSKDAISNGHSKCFLAVRNNCLIISTTPLLQDHSLHPLAISRRSLVSGVNRFHSRTLEVGHLRVALRPDVLREDCRFVVLHER